MFGRDSGDIDVVCPYNSSHIFPAKGLNGHLVRCRKNYMHLKKVACKFDVTHLVLKPELAHHHSICPSRIYLDRDLQMRAGGSKLMGNVSGPDIRSSYTENTGENWDSEPSHPGTNAIFSRASEFENGDVTITQNHSESAVPLLPTSSSSPTQEEENFCRVPLASSKAAQLSAAMAPSAKPRGSSNLVYEYSLQQAAVGRGRGLVTPPQGAQQATPVMLLQEPASPRSGVGRGNGSGAQLHSSPQRPSVGQRLRAQLENSLQQAVPKDQTVVSSETNTGT